MTYLFNSLKVKSRRVILNIHHKINKITNSLLAKFDARKKN